MKDKRFLDSNLLVYAHTNLDKEKQKIAQQIITDEHCIISTQVLKEVANVLFRKFDLDWKSIGNTKNIIFRFVNPFCDEVLHFKLVVKWVDFKIESLFFVNYLV